jgi:rare lipoprotein A
MAIQPMKQVIKASFYADKFEGRFMSGGGRFSQKRMSAASLQFPLGTVIRITSLKTGTSILLTVTDRGPWGKKFKLDLSKAAFKALGLKEAAGWGWVTVERLNDE